MPVRRGEVWFNHYIAAELPGNPILWLVECRVCPHLEDGITSRWPARREARTHARTHPDTDARRGR
jgi:hypothetical protein